MQSKAYDAVVSWTRNRRALRWPSGGLTGPLGRGPREVPKEDRGGQTGYSESFRVPSAETDLEPYGYEFDVPDYTADEFYEDITSRTNGKANGELVRTLVDNPSETVEWLTEHGVNWDMEPLAVGHTAGRKWFDNDHLLEQLTSEIEAHGGDIYYRTSAEDIEFEGTAVTGVETVSVDDRLFFDCDAVVLASGAYESSSEKRVRYYALDSTT